MDDIKFSDSYSLEVRIKESRRLMDKFPDRIPVIVEPDNEINSRFFGSSKKINIDKKKYLVPKDLSMGQFFVIIRKRIKLAESEAMFMFVGDKILVIPTETIGDMYEKYRSEDNFLTFNVSLENTFG